MSDLTTSPVVKIKSASSFIKLKRDGLILLDKWRVLIKLTLVNLAAKPPNHVSLPLCVFTILIEFFKIIFINRNNV